MKLSLQSPSFYNDDQDVQHRIELISKLPYANNIHDDWLNDHFIKEDHNSRIRSSKYTSQEEWSETSEKPNKNDHFTYSITTSGLGYTFNPSNFWTMYKKTRFTKALATIMRPKN